MQKKVSLEDFNTLSFIGKGNYAKVILVKRKENQKIYALKILKKRKLEQRSHQKQLAFLERQIMIQSTHPFIIKCINTFQNEKRLFFVLQYCCGGELLGILKRKNRLSQQMQIYGDLGRNFTQLRFYQGQSICITRGFYIQNSLKPQNILIDQSGYIKLTDFGLSRKMNSQQTFIVGTPQYLAPQTLNKIPLTVATDWWQFGTIIYEMITGLPPFYNQQQSKAVLFSRIRTQNPKYPSNISKSLKSLLTGLLEKDPQKRLGNKIQQIKQHVWFNNVNWQKLLQKGINAPFVPSLKNQQDVSCFDPEFTQNQQQFSPQMYIMNSGGSNKSFKGFSYTRSKCSCQDASPGSYDIQMIQVQYD